MAKMNTRYAPALTGVKTSHPGSSFDPLTASDKDLAANYLPPRPDSQTAPTAFANWQRALGTRPRYVAGPEAEPTSPDQDKGFVTHPNDGQTQASSGNWSGGVVRPRDHGPMVLVQGRWIVPDTQQPGNKDEPFASSVWVGLDGYDPASRIMPQIGTGQVYYLVMQKPVPVVLQTYVAWWQVWLKGARRSGIWQQPIPALPIAPEDRFYGQVQALDEYTMSFFLKNETQNVAFSAYYDLRADHTGYDLMPIERRTAEWVIERPTVPDPADSTGVTPLSVPLANYGETAFTDCNAASLGPHGKLSEFQLQEARLFRMNQWVKLPSSNYALAPADQEPGHLTSLPRRIGDDALLMRYVGS